MLTLSTLLCENRLMKPRPAPYHHGNLRAALIDAGLKLIEEKGVRALTLREIGTRVGVSRMAAYRHFADKADLLAAICDVGFAQFADALEEAWHGARPDFRSRILAMALAYVRFAGEHRAHYEVMFGPSRHPREPAPPGNENGKRAFGILERTIREGQEAGEVRDGNPMMLARMVWALVHGISMLGLEPDLSPAGAGTKFVTFCSEMLQTGLAAEMPVPKGRRLHPAGVQ
jgi:AcrR family transcriptional regulator